MYDANSTEVHGMVVSHQTRLGGGQALPITIVTYYVGQHGPFTAEFAQGQDSSTAIKAVIQAKVNDIRQLLSSTF